MKTKYKWEIYRKGIFDGISKMVEHIDKNYQPKTYKFDPSDSEQHMIYSDGWEAAAGEFIDDMVKCKIISKKEEMEILKNFGI